MKLSTLALVLTVALLSALATGGGIYYVASSKDVRGPVYEIKLWWENFTDQFAERIVLAERQPKGDPYKNDYAFNDDNDWFTHKLPSWQVALTDFVGKPNLNYLEVGVYEGRSVLWMIENVLTHPTSTITAIDIFYEMDGAYSEALEQRYLDNLQLSGAAERSKTLVGFSQEKLRELPLYHYDIIYVDASHRAPQVLEDLIISHRLLKVGGVMILDDYRHWMHRPPLTRPKMAMDTFLEFYENQYEVLHMDYQVILRKLEPSSI